MTIDEEENPPAFDIKIEVISDYQQQESDPQQQRFVFTYEITIINRGFLALRLMSRHWIITDGNQQVLEISGEGVVGQQPLITPGESYCYTSGVVIETPMGSMEGSYQMISEEGQTYTAEIPTFSLIVPGMIH